MAKMEADIKSNYIKAGEINTHYLVAGEGPAIILLHGGGNDWREWKLNIGPLSECYSVYVPDLPGFGVSDKPKADYTVIYFVSFLSHFAEALGLEQFSLVGNSLGGGIALGFALEFPNKVEKLVVVDSLCLGRGIRFLARLAALSFLVKSWMKPSKGRIRRGLRKAIYNRQLITEGLVDELYQMQSIPGAKEAQLSIARSLMSLRGQRTVFLDRLPEIMAPTLIIWGKQDRILPMAHAYAAHKLIKGSKLHIFGNCGHSPQREKAEEFNQLVIEFLGSKEGRCSSQLLAVGDAHRKRPDLQKRWGVS